MGKVARPPAPPLPPWGAAGQVGQPAGGYTFWGDIAFGLIRLVGARNSAAEVLFPELLWFGVRGETVEAVLPIKQSNIGYLRDGPRVLGCGLEGCPVFLRA